MVLKLASPPLSATNAMADYATIAVVDENGVKTETRQIYYFLIYWTIAVYQPVLGGQSEVGLYERWPLTMDVMNWPQHNCPAQLPSAAL